MFSPKTWPMYILLKYVFTFPEFFGKSIGGNANVFACPTYLGHTPPIEMIQGNQGKWCGL